MTDIGPPARRRGMAALVLGAIGVVFGDIGTSPLYALHAVFTTGHHAVRPTEPGVYGVISLMFWTITLVVAVKYVTLIMRADNEGEGGIMALIALIQRTAEQSRAKAAVVTLGIFGAALFYGDGMITPAISVLSAVEGLDVAAPSLSSLVVPIALVVLLVLFGVQRFGSGAVGRLFGPIMGVWFAILALSGLREVVAHPGILRALAPTYGAEFIADRGATSFVIMAAVLLTVTGAEALYADMGHFGRPAIRRAWLLLVFPALTLNYMGQGALVLDTPSAIDNPFFLLAPHWSRIPMVLLATAATVIASQAVISGAFSITHQAVQLGYLPRLTIQHTSEEAAGQVYAPAVNWALCAAVAGLVVGFGSSADLAAAYGIAVAGTMTITTVLFCFMLRAGWKQPLAVTAAVGAALLSIDLALLSASLTKVPHGGWLPLSVALAVFTILTTWHTGHAAVIRNRIRQEGPLRAFVDEVRAADPPVFRAPGTAVFLHAERETTPLALRASFRHHHAVHESVVIVLLRTLNTPHVHPSRRVMVDDLGYRDDGITHVTARFGFRDRQDVPRTLALAAERGIERAIGADDRSYFLSRITLVRTGVRLMQPWRERLFVAMWRNQADASEYFALPDERTVIVGSLIEI